MNTKTRSIRYINWETERVQPGNETWVLPQITAQIGSHWPLVRDLKGVSPTLTLRGWITLAKNSDLTLDGSAVTPQGLKNLLGWLNTTPRGQILGALKQTGDGVRWSAPTPLVLSAFKEFREVQYSEWDWGDPNMKELVDGDIWEWSKLFWIPQPWGSDELTQFRVGALEVKSGRQQGTHRKPESCSQVYGVTDPEFKILPRLMKLSLVQLWCFHPRVRTPLMITNHMNLDNPPPPLVDSEILSSPTPQTSSVWDV